MSLSVNVSTPYQVVSAPLLGNPTQVINIAVIAQNVYVTGCSTTNTLTLTINPKLYPPQNLSTVLPWNNVSIISVGSNVTINAQPSANASNNFVLTAPAVNPSISKAKPKMATNAHWGDNTGIPITQDRMRQSRGFTQYIPGTGAITESPVAMAANGWPSGSLASPANIGVVLCEGSFGWISNATYWGGSNLNYNCGYVGTGHETINAYVSGTISNVSQCTTTGVCTFTFTPGHDANTFGFSIANAAAGISNVFAWLPQYANNSGYYANNLFTTEALNHYGQFSHLRWMQDSGVLNNVNDPYTATQRPNQANCHVPTNGNWMGLGSTEFKPVEWYFDFALAAGNGLWICAPIGDSDGTWIANVANVALNKLGANTTTPLYIEIGNELWDGWPCSGHLTVATNNYITANPGILSWDGDNNQQDLMYRYLATRLTQIANAFSPLFGSNFGPNGAVKIVFATQSVQWPTYWGRVVSLLQHYFPSTPVNNWVQVLSVANYLSRQNVGVDDGIPGIISDYVATMPKNYYSNFLESASRAAKEYGMQAILYEGTAGSQLDFGTAEWGTSNVTYALMNTGYQQAMQIACAGVFASGFDGWTVYDGDVPTFGVGAGNNTIAIGYSWSNNYPQLIANGSPKLNAAQQLTHTQPFSLLPPWSGGGIPIMPRNIVYSSGGSIYSNNYCDNLNGTWNNAAPVLTQFGGFGNITQGFTYGVSYLLYYQPTNGHASDNFYFIPTINSVGAHTTNVAVNPLVGVASSPAVNTLANVAIASGTNQANLGIITLKSGWNWITIGGTSTNMTLTGNIQFIPTYSLPSFNLTPTFTNVNGAWTFGHAFKQGDVFFGQFLTATNTSAFQADVRNYWPDSSVKYAVLSGISNFTAGQNTVIQLNLTSAPPSSNTVSEPSAAQVANVSTVFTTTSGTGYSIGHGLTCQLSTVLSGGAGPIAWNQNVGGMIRQVLGPVMSEFHYYQTVTATLHMFWYVRAYSTGAIEIERVIENGWWANNQTQQDYGVSSYSSNSSSPDFQLPYIGYNFPAQNTIASYFTGPATGEILVANGYAGVVDAGGIPVSNVTVANVSNSSACFLNGNSSAVFKITNSNQHAPAWSAATSYVAGQFVSNTNSFTFQALQASTNQPPPSTATSTAFWSCVASPSTTGQVWLQTTGGTLPATANALWLIGHFNFSQWSRVDWLGNGGQIIPSHDPNYLRSTKMVMNYAFTQPDSNAWTGFVTQYNPVPFSVGNYTPVLGNEGYQADIGILPSWEALYCTTANSIAYNTTSSNYRSGGRWPMHVRDPNTGRAFNYANFPNSQFYTTQPLIGISTDQPSFIAGGTMGTWDIAHSPSMGYLAYLLEGRWSQLESAQFAASLAIMYQSPLNRPPSPSTVTGVMCADGISSTRGTGWAWRSLAQAAAIGPRNLAGKSAVPVGDQTIINAHVSSLSNTALWHNQKYIIGNTYGGTFLNNIGWLGQIDNYNSNPPPQGPVGGANAWYGANWMVNFQSMALCHAYELSVEGLPNPADLLAIRNFSYLNQLLVTGDDTTFNFRYGIGMYSRPYLVAGSTYQAPVFLTIPQQYQIYINNLIDANVNAAANISANRGDYIIKNGTASPTGPFPNNFTTDFSVGYSAEATSVLGMAIDAGLPGAQNAFNTAVFASNYYPSWIQNGANSTTIANNAPQFAFAPRTLPNTINMGVAGVGYQ